MSWLMLQTWILVVIAFILGSAAAWVLAKARAGAKEVR